MNYIRLSRHADLRCAQRGICQEIIRIILDYGREDYDHRGACRYYLGRYEKRHLAKDSPDLFRKYGRKLDTVVVATSTGSPCVITAFVRNRGY